ncbi:MAG TPA: hypothetical protein VFW45_13715 [Candidatus Polarisedimenticolia bacterium]|nr:hypothetical protein [Candidatus Polarisedimenticolia bacterium]
MRSVWIGKLAAVMVVLAGLAVMSATGPTPAVNLDPGIDPAQFPAGSDCGLDPGQLPPGFFDQGAVNPEPVAICRLLPECWSDSDCDARCGAGLGKCVHSNCPPRLCKCR